MYYITLHESEALADDAMKRFDLDQSGALSFDEVEMAWHVRISSLNH